MGKVRDEAAAAKPAKPASKEASPRTASRLGPFLANLVQTRRYKPNQGWYARLWTMIGLGVLVAAGLYRLQATQLGDYSIPFQTGVLAALGLPLAWLVYRVCEYPPFVDFLIATEAEMNKVSWATREELKRATIVVLVTVLLMAVYLFGVDWVWSTILQWIGVLRFQSSEFGAQAG